MVKSLFKKSSTFALILVLTLSAMIVSLPAVTAADVDVDTYIHVMVAPNPVGAGQTVVVTIQMDKVSPTALGVYGGDHFQDVTVEVTKPDGTTETLGPFELWATSGTFTFYTPTMVGTYSFQANFPGQEISTPARVYWFKPSTSRVTELTVQSDPIEPYPNVPFPTEYWRRPIYGENKGWWKIADNWLMQAYDKTQRSFCVSTAFSPYTEAPDSSHILWSKPIIFGGMAGGKYEDLNYYTGLSYEQFYLPLILEGRIYYVEHGPATRDIYGTRCLDLYTGEEIWYLDGVNIVMAQIYNIENPNEHGLIAHLWEFSGPSSNTTKIYDAFTGKYIATMTNITWGGLGAFRGGATVFGPNGEILSYNLDATNNRLILWNSSKAIHTAFPWIGGEVGAVYSLPVGAIVDGRLGIQWNVSIPAVTPGTQISTVDEGYILAQSRDTSTYPYVYTDRAYDAETGAQLWVKDRTEIYSSFMRRPMNIEGVYVMHDEAKLQHHGYSIQTGERLWSTEPLTSGWGIFTYQQHIAYGKLYTTGYDGYVRAYDISNGQLVWDYYLGNAGLETVYSSYPTYNGFTIADGKIYLSSDEHSPDAVPWRGGKLWCLDAETGELVWSISGWLRNPAISDGILTALNSLNGEVYTFGKGPTATSVTAAPKVSANGGTVLIEGSVFDVSPGASQKGVVERFPNGLPAVSDESMTAWMEYVYMQKPRPEDITGVSVHLTAIDPNGNFQDIGYATTDGSGNFGLAWTPPVPGVYQVTASFEGSNSYWPSSATTYFVVEEAPAAAQPIEPEQPEAAAEPEAPEEPEVPTEPEQPAEAPLITTDLAIILAVVIVAVVAIVGYWILRKRR